MLIRMGLIFGWLTVLELLVGSINLLALWYKILIAPHKCEKDSIFVLPVYELNPYYCLEDMGMVFHLMVLAILYDCVFLEIKILPFVFRNDFELIL